jgi:P4 family phage/plasmid primase-like protien
MSADEQGLKTLRSAAYYKSVRALEGIVRMTGRIMAVRPEVFDAHPRLLNVGNGVVDLATGELSPHDPTLFLSKLAGGDYVPGLKHRDVEAVIGCVDPDTRPTLQQLLGAAASGEASADMVPILDGAGSNGKTTVLIAASAALGDYAASVPTALVMQSARDEHPTLYETLRGLRIAVIEETEEDGGLRVERVKQLSGGGTISARPMRGNWYTFEPTHTLVIATNHRPIVNSAEFSIWRRLKLVPFPYRYVRAVASATDRPIDAGLRDRAKRHKAVRSAFLTFIVDGAVEAYDNGGGDVPLVLWSEAVTAATNEWRGAEDVIGRFLAERVRFDAAASVKGTEVFEAWKEWCEAENRPPGQAKNFHRRVQSHGSLNSAAEAYVRDGSTWYRGLECLSGHHSDLSDWNP